MQTLQHHIPGTTGARADLVADRARALADLDRAARALQPDHWDPAEARDCLERVLAHLASYPTLDPRRYDGRQLVNPLTAHLRNLTGDADREQRERITAFATGRLAATRTLLTVAQDAMDRINARAR